MALISSLRNHREAVVGLVCDEYNQLEPMSHSITKTSPKRQRERVGRPSKLNLETVTKLEHAFSIGCNVTEACLHGGISRNTYYRHVAENTEFRDRFEGLQQRPALRARNTLFEALKHDSGLAFKYLVRTHPEEFGAKRLSPANQNIIVQVIQY